MNIETSLDHSGSSDQTNRGNPTLRMNSPLFWLTLVVPLGIIGLGFNFLFNPVGASAGFGVPVHDPAAFPFMWTKGVRDIFSGVIVLTFLLRGDLKTTATLYAIAIFIPLCDGLIILKQLGFAPPIFIHWGTALYMIVVATLLLRKTRT